MTYARITGTGAYLPENVMTNHDLEKIVDTTDTYVAVIEIVSDGSADGWVERPRTIKLSGLDGL